MQRIFNNKSWFVAAVVALFMTGCFHSDDKKGTNDPSAGGTGSGNGGSGGGGGGGNTTPAGAGPALVNLATAGNFVILAKEQIAAYDPLITGDIGVSPGPSNPMDGNGINGFLETPEDGSAPFSTSARVTGKIYAANYAAPTPTMLNTAITEMAAAYTDASVRTAPEPIDLGDGEIGGKTLAPGLYRATGPILISSNVTLAGGPNDVWIFQVGGDLNQAGGTTPDSAAKVVLTGGAQAKNIFWQVTGDGLGDSDVYLGENAHFEGTILARNQVSLGTKATMKGRVLSQYIVTLDQSTVTQP